MEKKKIVKDICPCCGRKALEKIKTPPGMEWLLDTPGYENWGCAKCGQSFWKKIEADT